MSHGRDAAALNLLRTKVRETEVSAARIYIDCYFQVIRPDIMQALNRLSSAVYVLMVMVVREGGVMTTQALKQALMQGEHMLIERCRQQAKLNPPRVVLPDALDERVIHAARYLKQNGLAEPVLLANPFALRDFSLRTGVIMDGLSTIDPDSADEWRAEFADTITARLGEKPGRCG